jgi:3-hydroxybutyryl-CoA dehydrogenase
MIKNISVIGAGTMGKGVALAFAMNGYNVNVVESNEQILNSVKTTTKELLNTFYEEEIISFDEIEKSLNNINLFDNIEEAVKESDYVIEAVPENIQIKQELFKKLDKLCPEHTILTSNTSSLKMTDMMEYISDERKKKFMITHWYNPAHIIPIAELSYFGNMDEEQYIVIEELYKSIGKETIKVLKEVPGLVANRIQQGIAREVFSLIENGVASPEDIDKAIKFGPGFRYATTGQLEISDFGGLDIWCIVGDNLLAVMDNSKTANKLLQEKVAEGKLGIKSGEGFFDYSGDKGKEALEKYTKKLLHQLKASNYYK